MHNGQPTGAQNASTTEDGAYAINGYIGNDGRTILRKPGAKWFIPNESEWYKAAYYKGGGTSAGYWNYPTRNDALPSNVLGNPTDPGNNATYYRNGYTIGTPYYRTEVGAHENSESAYNTFDQGGNLYEWNEAIFAQDASNASRGIRGGSFYHDNNAMHASYRSASIPSNEFFNGYYIGFRVSAVPEPSSLMILAGGIGMILGIRRRRA